MDTILSQPAVNIEDSIYYMKCQILSHLTPSEPIPGSAHIPSESGTAAEQYRINNDLALADHLSLFMVSEAHGDVCATYISHPGLGHLTFYVAKNQVKEADKEHLTRLIGLCQGGFLDRWPDYSRFQEAAMALLINFCEKKMRKRLQELSWVLLSALAAELEGSELRGLKEWDERLSQGQAEQGDIRQAVQDITGKPLQEGSSDIAVFSWAVNSQKKITAVVVEQLGFLVRSLEVETPDILSSVSLLSRFSDIADTFHRSALFGALLRESEVWPGVKTQINDGLGKVGAYSRGLELLYRTFSEIEMSGNGPLHIRYQLLDSPPIIMVDLGQFGDWYRFLEEFSASPGGGEQPLGVGREDLEAVWKGNGRITNVQQIPLTLHCELQLIQFLEKRGTRKGAIGVSKPPCLGCSIVLGGMHILGAGWVTSGTNGKSYVGMLPGDRVLATVIKKKIDTLLRDELDKARNSIKTPVPAVEHRARVLPGEFEELI